MAVVTDSNRPQPLWQPPPTACLTASAASSLPMHPWVWGSGVLLLPASPPQVGMFRTEATDGAITFLETLELDMATVLPCVAGPKRPHDNVACKDLQGDFQKCMAAPGGFKGFGVPEEKRGASSTLTYEGKEYPINHGDVVIAAITSCTNTSNPAVLLAAGLVCKKAKELGLMTKPYIKTSLSPGSQVLPHRDLSLPPSPHTNTEAFCQPPPPPPPQGWTIGVRYRF